jgi:hypothetical protein
MELRSIIVIAGMVSAWVVDPAIAQSDGSHVLHDQPALPPSPDGRIIFDTTVTIDNLGQPPADGADPAPHVSPASPDTADPAHLDFDTAVARRRAQREDAAATPPAPRQQGQSDGNGCVRTETGFRCRHVTSSGHDGGGAASDTVHRELDSLRVPPPR